VTHRRAAIAFGTAAAFLAVAVAAGLLIGPAGVPSLPLSPTEETIVLELRAPRVALAVLVGAMLAVAGGAYQGVFRNALADPYLLGIAAGAGLAATLAIAYGPPGTGTSVLLPAAAFVGAAGSVAVT
jgi:iron complex transport system permease protein